MVLASTDERVRQLIDAGELRQAVEVALQDLGSDVLRYLRSVLRDEDDAADAYSQISERIWKGLPSFRSESSLRTWVMRLAVNVVANLRNEAWRRRVRRLQTGETSNLAAESRRSSLWRADQLDGLRQVLSVEEQSLLVFRIDQGLSWKEVAEILSAEGRTVSAVALQKRFERLKERLARMAKEQGILS